MNKLQRCYLCGQTKSIGEFYKDKSRKSGFCNKCKKCSNLVRKENRKKNPEEVAKCRERVKRWKRRFKDSVSKIKMQGCIVCGYSRCTDALDFHHVGEGKECCVSMVTSYAQLRRELSRCVVVCANCHREIHAGLVNVGLKDKQHTLFSDIDE